MTEHLPNMHKTMGSITNIDEKNFYDDFKAKIKYTQFSSL